jgi:hypothetical protein
MCVINSQFCLLAHKEVEAEEQIEMTCYVLDED